MFLEAGFIATHAAGSVVLTSPLLDYRPVEGNGNLLNVPNERALYWTLHRSTIKENDHRGRTLHLLPLLLHSLCFLLLTIFLFPTLP